MFMYGLWLFMVYVPSVVSFACGSYIISGLIPVYVMCLIVSCCISVSVGTLHIICMSCFPGVVSMFVVCIILFVVSSVLDCSLSIAILHVLCMSVSILIGMFVVVYAYWKVLCLCLLCVLFCLWCLVFLIVRCLLLYCMCFVCLFLFLLVCLLSCMRIGNCFVCVLVCLCRILYFFVWLFVLLPYWCM